MQLKINSRVFRYIKFILIFLAFYFLIYKTGHKIADENYIEFLTMHLSNKKFVFILFTLLFICFINWGLESYKWYYIRGKEDSIKESFASVLCGLGLSMFMPNRGGEFIGRVLYISSKKKIKNAVLSFITSYSQQLFTVIFGVVSLTLVKNYFDFNNYLFLLLVIFGVLFCLIYVLLPIIFKWKRWSKFNLTEYKINFRLLGLLSLLSFFRYLAFTIPYFILFIYFDIIDNANFIQLWALLNIQFLITSYVPGFILTDAGIRSGISVYLFDLIGVSALVAFTITIIIWMVNVFIPAFIGILLAVKLRPPQIIE